MNSSEPLVSIVTPVYNGEAFLAECIESILAQDYPNWDYLVVNNCSTDGTLALAERYAARDKRIRVTTNETFLSTLENFDHAVHAISPGAAFCKMVCADDWLMPGALTKMVRLATAHPTIGIVSSLRKQSNGAVKCAEFPVDVDVMSGRETCRRGLLQGIHAFGSPTNLLYRADLIRRTPAFFPHRESHADTSACYAALDGYDFGFVHEILSVERVHEGQVTSRVRRLGADYYAYLQILLQYGPRYLTETEFGARREELLADWYRMLGCGVLKMKRREFWDFHRAKLRELGYRFDRRRVLMEAVRELAAEARNPETALRKLQSALGERKKKILKPV